MREMTRDTYNALHPDYRGTMNGLPHVLALDRGTGATVLVPVRFIATERSR